MAKPIFLLGFMGSGKTSIGKKLANRLNLDFYDLDDFIESAQNLSITELFNDRGEAGFREIEHESLKLISEKENSVIALGGGTPCSDRNLKLIKNSGISVYLKLDEPILVGRLRLKKAKRPLIAKLDDAAISQFVHQKIQERETFYKQADYTLESNHPNAKMIVTMLNVE